jgi:HAD superfamily hydrolase (TIGR01490 family)
MLFARYAGQTEDRLRFFAQQLFDDVLRPSLRPGARDLIEQSRTLGFRQVVVTGALDITIAPLLAHLGITDYGANRLEFIDGVATGRLLPPVLAAATKALWIRQFAAREGIDLNASRGYSDSMSDLPMLSVVGHPVAVNPGLRLRTLAREHDWPVLDLR